MYTRDVQRPKPVAFVEMRCQLGDRSGIEAS